MPYHTPVKPDELRRRLRDRQPVFGTWLQTPSPEVVEILGWANFDFVILDLEHGYFGPEAVPHLIRAAEVVSCSALVRVPQEATEHIGKVLDAGAGGVVIPGVTSAAVGQERAALTRYAPLGRRGVSPSTRSLRYSASPVPDAGDERAAPLVVLQVEAKLATERLAEIVAIKPLDVIFIGPYDLSASLGLTGQLRHPHVLSAMSEIVAQAAATGLTIGTWMPEAADARAWLDQGVTFITVSNNEMLFYRAARELRQALE